MNLPFTSRKISELSYLSPAERSVNLVTFHQQKDQWNSDHLQQAGLASSLRRLPPFKVSAYKLFPPVVAIAIDGSFLRLVERELFPERQWRGARPHEWTATVTSVLRRAAIRACLLFVIGQSQGSVHKPLLLKTKESRSGESSLRRPLTSVPPYRRTNRLTVRSTQRGLYSLQGPAGGASSRLSSFLGLYNTHLRTGSV